MYRKLAFSAFIFFTILFITISSTQAYLDPGTGSMILQGVIAAIAAISVITKIYWNKISRFLGFSKENKSQNNDSDASGENKKP